MLKAVEYYKEKLEKEEENTSAHVQADCEFPEGAVGLCQKMELSWRIQEKERHLEEIKRALQKLEKDAYGICERCGSPIDSERLEVLPWTTLCVACKNHRECSSLTRR